jgi:hypothetical protein
MVEAIRHQRNLDEKIIKSHFSKRFCRALMELREGGKSQFAIR